MPQDLRKPTLGKGPASDYEGRTEIIREFSDATSGGLISIRRDPERGLVVEVYRCDDDVRVLAPTKNLGWKS